MKVPVGKLPIFLPAVPKRVVDPVFVIPEPAKTAYEEAEPKFTVGTSIEACELVMNASGIVAMKANAATTPITLLFLKSLIEPFWLLYLICGSLDF